jgi:hypothetical protein
MISPLFINAGWELKGPGRVICRWFACWKVLSQNEFSGTIAGYSGGGSFQVENFYAKTKNKSLSELWIDCYDRISGEEIEFVNAGKDALAACNQATECLWQWNDENEWLESDEVKLLEGIGHELILKDDMYYYANENNPFIRLICEESGITAGPISS